MTRNLCKKVLSAGGSIVPLMISPQDSKGLGLMNPSILLDQTKILLNLRNINYTLYHSENNQVFNNRWGPLVYLNPENDMHLRTFNFYCELDPNDLHIVKYCPIDTSAFDKEPLWEFVGLEDIRLVRWEGRLFGCGVRRDTTTNGQGRMELSELEEKDPITLKPGESPIKEISRTRIEPPGPSTYCEKNWMPILDMPWHFVKWCNPTQVVKVNLNTKTSETVFLSKSHIPNMPDFRGGSQVINYKDYRVCLVHEVNLFNNKLQQKDATYMHRFLVWDKKWNLIKMSESFSFMDGEIEFCCGMTLYKNDLLVTFGFQDNAAFVLRIPEKIIDEIFGFKKLEFDWSIIGENQWFKQILNKEIFENNVYQKYFEVEKDDIVVDVGASVGPFTYSILNKKPKRVFCIEPSKELFPALLKNTKNENVICINKGISNKNGNIIFKGLFNKHSNEMWSSNIEAKSIRFDTFVYDYNISKIDFLKVDCEGGEYDIFNDSNLSWIVNNVKKIAGKFHIHNDELKEKFKIFRETYLKTFTDFRVEAMDGTDIKWDLWNDHFLNYYAEVMIFIDNRPKIIEEPKIKLAVKNFMTATPSGKKEDSNDLTIDFNWGEVLRENPAICKGFEKEIFIKKIYQKFFDVEEGDVVVDIGASVGPFAYSVFEKSPKHIYCLEPSLELFNTLVDNTKSFSSITNIDKGIGDKDSNEFKFSGMYGKGYVNIPGNPTKAKSIKFSSFIKEYNIEKIDFLKIDAEGGEYDIFNDENLEWITQNVKKIVVEFHFHNELHQNKFEHFKNTYLKEFTNFQIYSLTDVDIKPTLWDPNFVRNNSQYSAITVYIDNRVKPIKKIKKWQTTKWPTFEITTNILSKGCVMNCVFCPQKTLLEKYNDKRLLSLDDFKKALDKIPKEITIIFSGFSEPWLNRNCTEMVLYAHEKGHQICIFTTGIGMEIEDFERIKHIPFSSGPDQPLTGYMGYPINNGGFTMHLPDNEQYAHHPITSKYIKLLEHIKENSNKIHNFHLTCMGTVHDKVKHIFPTAPNSDVWARANNLINEEKLRPEIIPIISGHYKSAYRGENSVTCMCDEKLYHNVMLPNGDIVLCCMDYSLEHILGNIFTQEFDDIIPEPETKFNLCRFCENGAQPQ